MKYKLVKFFIILFHFSFLSNCIIKAQQTRECKARPQFISKIKDFDVSRSAVSTTELNHAGLVIIEMEQPQNPNSKRTKTYIHETWKMSGHAGPFTIDQYGNIYLVPAPKVNVLENPMKDQNKIFMVNSATGIMTELMNLPHLGPDLVNNPQNPFGLVGIYYDCQDYSIFASSLYGSLTNEENGMIYHIDPVNKKVISSKKGIDAFGIITYQMGPEKRLLYGSARTGDVYSIKINQTGVFEGTPRKEFTVDGLGVRGDDKVRKFRILNNGDLKVYGLEFYYNLTAPTEKPESEYVFRYIESTRTWQQIQ
jgi:hypothetical protein